MGEEFQSFRFFWPYIYLQSAVSLHNSYRVYIYVIKKVGNCTVQDLIKLIQIVGFVNGSSRSHTELAYSRQQCTLCHAIFGIDILYCRRFFDYYILEIGPNGWRYSLCTLVIKVLENLICLCPACYCIVFQCEKRGSGSLPSWHRLWFGRTEGVSQGETQMDTRGGMYTNFNPELSKTI